MYEYIGADHWARTTVYELARWKNGLAFKNINFSQFGRPVIKIAELKSGVTDQTKFTDAEYDEAVSVKSGDMLFSWSGNPDTSIDVFRWDGPDGWLNQHIYKVTPRDGIREDYLFFLLRWLKPRFAEIARNKQTTGLGHVTLQDFKNMAVGVPSPVEQEAIVSFVGPIQKRLDLNRRMNETLEALARALFKDWFVDFGPTRAKMEGREAYLRSAIWELFPADLDDGAQPRGWQIGCLKDLVLLQRGFDLPKSKRTEGRYPVIAASGVNGFHCEAKVTGPGVVTGRSGVIGNVFFTHDDFWPLNTSLWVKEYPNSSPVHAYFLLQTLDFASYNSGSAVPTLNRNHVHGLPMPIPPKALIEAYDDIVAPLLRQQRANAAENDTLSQTRDVLLPKLMSGEIRLRDAEKQVEAVA